jgi:hypothetical protein
MVSNFYITSRLAKVSRTEEEDRILFDFFSNMKNKHDTQHDFFCYSKLWKLAPWLYVQLKRSNLFDLLDAETQLNFCASYEKIKNENLNRNSEAKRFLAEFIKENIDVVILKGNLFLYTVYDDIGYKKMNDFDMLIRVQDWKKVQEIYLKLNYIPLGFGWGGEKGEVARYSHAGLSYISPNYCCITGTQWGIKSPTSSYKIDIDEAWTTASNFMFDGIEVKQFSAEYNLLHLILHMGIYKCGIRDCMDVYNLLLSEQKFDEDYFVEICYKANAVDKAFFTLKLTDLCCGSISKTLIEKLIPNTKSFLYSRLEERLKMAETTGDMQLAYNDCFHEIEMTVFYFSLFSTFHRKIWLFLRMLVQLFWPDNDLVIKLSALSGKINLWQKVKARIKAPYLVFSLISEEIGSGITTLLLLKMFFDSIISIKNYFVKKESYFEYLKNKGIDSNAIQKAVKNIQ